VHQKQAGFRKHRSCREQIFAFGLRH